MARPRRTKPTDAELKILRTLWRKGPATIRDLCDGHQADTGREMKPTTMSSAVQEMLARGLVTIIDRRRPQKFAAAVDEGDLYHSFLTDLRDRLFGGSLKRLVQHALDGEKPSQAEIAELKDLIDQSEIDPPKTDQ